LGWEYLDTVFLAVVLALATYLAMLRRSRRGLFGLTIVSLAWLGFWRAGCVCPIGAIQNVTLAIVDPAYAIPFSVVVFFSLPLVFALFFGRTFCAAVCPLGAVQEMVAVRPVKVPAWVDHALGLLPYVYLGGAVLFAATQTTFIICNYDPFVGFFRRSASASMLVFGACFLVIGFFVGRPYCRYLCPYGALLGLCSKVSKRHVRIPPGECIKCRLCEDACPYGAIQSPTVDQTARQRLRGRRRLALLLVLFPVLIAIGAWIGHATAVPLSRLHPTAALAERIRLEETGQVEGTIDSSDAFRNTGRPAKELYAEALALHARFAVAGAWFGAWVGLVVGVKLIHLSIRRRRTEYQPDKANCVSCGRCFWYCPVEQLRLGLIQILPPVPSAPTQP
jgi:polyferredoxin